MCRRPPHLALERSPSYGSPVTMRTAASARAAKERNVRVILIAMTAPIPCGVAFLIWFLGFDVHPHRILYACIVAAVWVVFACLSASVFYWAGMKGIARSSSNIGS